MNALQLCHWQLSHEKKLCSRLSSREVRFYTENGRFTFLSPPPQMATRSCWAHWKAHSGLPISVNWTFFARYYGWGTTSEYRFKIGDFAPTGASWPKISGRRGRPEQTFLFSQKAKWSFIWYKNLDRCFFHFVTMHAFDRQTDGQMDREFSSLDRVCIPCSAVETSKLFRWRV